MFSPDVTSMLTPLKGPLYLGVRNEHVKRMQESLNTHRFLGLGTPITADGAFGAKTDHRVRAFQKGRQLKADGIVGPLTAKALGFTSYSQGAPPQRPSLPARPKQIPGEAPPRPAPSTDPSPLALLAEILMNHIVSAGYEIANVFERAAQILGEDVLPMCRQLRDGARGIGQQVRQAILAAMTSGAQSIVQIIRNAQAQMRRQVDVFLNAVKNIGYAIGALVLAVVTKLREMVDYVFDRGVGVATGVGGSVEAYAREVGSAIYNALASIIDTARRLT